MALYTIILDYAGGTYVAQMRARSPHAASIKWARTFDIDDFHKLGSKERDSLIAQIESVKPVQLNSILNTWCSSFTIAKRLGLINLVHTAETK